MSTSMILPFPGPVSGPMVPAGLPAPDADAVASGGGAAFAALIEASDALLVGNAPASPSLPGVALGQPPASAPLIAPLPATGADEAPTTESGDAEANLTSAPIAPSPPPSPPLTSLPDTPVSKPVVQPDANAGPITTPPLESGQVAPQEKPTPTGKKEPVKPSADDAETDGIGADVAGQDMPASLPVQVNISPIALVPVVTQPVGTGASAETVGPDAATDIKGDAAAMPVAARVAEVKPAPSPQDSPSLTTSEPDATSAAPASGTADAAAQVRAPTSERADNSGLSSPLLTQTMAPVASKPAGSPYPAVPATPHMPVVQAQPGRIGADIGVEIARMAKGGREDLLIRLDPREMGRIDVRLSFDRDGILRAVMSADSPTALEMLRRESGDLNRALADAGIRADGQSLRFDARGGDQRQGGGQGHAGQHGRDDGASSGGLAGDGASDLVEPHYQPLRGSGQVDLMA
jgi:flagellar hook-length control protein FliK